VIRPTVAVPAVGVPPPAAATNRYCLACTLARSGADRLGALTIRPRRGNPGVFAGGNALAWPARPGPSRRGEDTIEPRSVDSNVGGLGNRLGTAADPRFIRRGAHVGRKHDSEP